MSPNNQANTDGPTLIFACSGAADVGCIADRAARRMTSDGTGRMFCMAGIGPRIDGIIKTARAARAILAIDGCEIDCVKKGLEQAGFADFKHLRVTDMGMQKASTPPTDEKVAAVAQKGAELIARDVRST